MPESDDVRAGYGIQLGPQGVATDAGNRGNEGVAVSGVDSLGVLNMGGANMVAGSHGGLEGTGALDLCVFTTHEARA